MNRRDIDAFIAARLAARRAEFGDVQMSAATGAIGTMQSPGAQSTHQAQQLQNLQGFMTWARRRVIIQTGTIANGATGGSPALGGVTFVRDIPEVPLWCTDIYIEAQLPLTMTTPASSTTLISQYFPWTLIQTQLLLAGSPPWDLISQVPWWIDEVTSRTDFDPTYSNPSALPQQFDAGPLPYASPNFTPGATITASGSPVVTAGTIQFSSHMRMQRRRHLMFGTVPLGDPENRPKLNIQLGGLVGTSPETNSFATGTGTATTASLSALGNITVVYVGRSIDIVPDSVGQIPTPIVGMGLTVNYSTKSITNAGQIFPIPHTASMVYEKILHAMFNANAVLRSDYFGFWVTGEQASNRWEFDAAQSSFNAYYDLEGRQYNRFLPIGCYVADFESGDIPELPQETPYNGLVTPDTGYAAEFGIPATPAMQTAVRIPTGTTINGGYCAYWEFGLVNVPY